MHGTESPSPWVCRWTHLIAPGGTALDVACGAGRHLRWLQGTSSGLTGAAVWRSTAAQPHQHGVWIGADRAGRRRRQALRSRPSVHARRDVQPAATGLVASGVR